MRVQAAIFVLLCIAINVSAQHQISGTVTDENQEPLAFATVEEVGTNKGTVTDLDGYFTLNVSSRNAKINFSYTGYRAEIIMLEGEKELDIIMMIDSVFGCGIIITVRASPINIPLPASLFKILPQHLERDIDLSVLPALNRVPGVHAHSGALNTNRITMRGIGNRSPFSTTKIRAYLDDIPLTTGDGETTIEDIDLSLIDRIDVYKGPTASIYGAGLGGMIHLKTANENKSKKSEISSQFTGGSYGLLRNSTTLNLTPNDKLNLRFNYNNTHQDGYRDNNNYDRQGVGFLGEYQANEKNTTTLLANYIDVKAFITSSLNRNDYENNPRAAAANWANVNGSEDYDKLILGLSHRAFISESKDVFKIYNKTSIFATARNNYEVRPFNILDEKSRTFGARTSFELTERGKESEAFPTLSIGAEFFKENYDWQTFETEENAQGALLSDNSEDRIYYNIFAQYYAKIYSNFYLLAGVNLNQTRYTYQDLFLSNGDTSGDYNFDAVLSPRLGLSYNFDYDISIFTTVSHGFSPPSLSETLTPDGQINPEIQPEKGWNIEVGSRGNFRYGKFQYEVTLYSMLIKDLLVAQRVAEDQFVGKNAGKTLHRGLESYVSYVLPFFKENDITAWASYTFSDYKFLEFTDAENDYAGNDLTGTPPHNLNIGIDYIRYDKLYGNLNFKYLSAFPIRDDNSIYSEAYSLLNAKLGYKIRLGNKWNLDIHAGIRNILNEKYASMILINAGSFGGNAPRYYYPGLPRNVFGGVKLNYVFN